MDIDRLIAVSRLTASLSRATTLDEVYTIAPEALPDTLGIARAAFLAEASAVLASSLDYEKTMQQVAELIVPDLCDWCVIDLMDDEGAVQRVAVVHRDPEKAEWVSRLKNQPPNELRNQYVGRVI